MKKKITIRDIAKRANVSVATVSNVINNINKVSDETREKILKIIEELEYQPDFTARSLSNRKSNLIGIILPLIEEDSNQSTLLRDNPFYSEFISGVEYEARKHGYDVLITGIAKNQSCKEWVDKRNLDGLIFLGIYPEILYQEMQKLNIPIVLIDSDKAHSYGFYNISIDDVLGGYIATKHLLSLGHTKIALATGSLEDSNVNFNRYIGYKKALEEHNIDVSDDLIFIDNISFDGGYKLGNEILKSNKNITAIFSVADIVAYGIMKCFHDNKIKIPDDYSIVGFDNLKVGEFVYPPLTTINQNIFQKGIVAVDTIINHIENKEAFNKNIELPIELIVKNSTKKVDI